MKPPLITLVISTIGRVNSLDRLLESVERSPVADRIQLVVVDQSDDSRCAHLVERRRPVGPWRVATSGRGVSTGRNVGLKLADADIVAFPDDDCWYTAATVPDVLRILGERPELAGVSARQLTSCHQPSMLRWLNRQTPVTRRNFLRTTISSTLFLRRCTVDEIGAFDEGLGVGSPGPHGAAEDSDLVLRLLGAGRALEYRPEVVVHQNDERSAPTAEFADKMLRYGAGHGYVWRRHGLPVSHLIFLSGRKLAGAAFRAARGQPILASADLAFLRGTFRGWSGAAAHAGSSNVRAP